jgi:hypothetical protein
MKRWLSIERHFKPMMKISIPLLLTAAMLSFALALPANAARWVPSGADPWLWIDLDSRTTRDGVTYYVEAHSAQSGVPPDVAGTLSSIAPELSDGVNCTTGQIYRHSITNYDEWMEAGEAEDYSVQPIYAWIDETARVSADRKAAIRSVVCGQ